MLARGWAKETLIHCWWEFKMANPLGIVWQFLIKQKVIVILLGVCPSEFFIQKLIQKFIAA